MKKLKEYAGGGYIPTNGIPSPDNDMLEHEIMEIQAAQKAGSNPWINALEILGHTGLQVGAKVGGPKAALLGSAIQTGDYLTMAFGGRVNLAPINKKVEVEGDEVAELPDGETVKFEGPSHEDGGIATELPAGTEVYSDRIEIDGSTIAKRKEQRANKLAKLAKRLEKNPNDGTLKQTYERMQENDELISHQEMQLQEMVGAVMDTNQPADDSPEMAYGGYVDPGMLFLLAQAMGTEAPDISGTTPGVDFEATEQYRKKNPYTPIDKTAGDPSGGASLTNDPASVGGGGAEGVLNGIPDTGMTGGDAVALLGNLISTFGPMKNTKENRANDRPNINYFENFGEDALDTIDESKDFLDEMKADAKMDLEVSKRGAMNQNRKSARSVNTMRALDTATHQSAMNTERDINSGFAERMLDILGQEANFENQRDFRQMFGEQQKDIADRMDQDAYYSQLAQDIATKGQGLQKTGGDLNRIQEQQQIQKLLSSMTKYFDIDSTGNITKKGG